SPAAVAAPVRNQLPPTSSTVRVHPEPGRCTHWSSHDAEFPVCAMSDHRPTRPLELAVITRGSFQRLLESRVFTDQPEAVGRRTTIVPAPTSAPGSYAIHGTPG